MGFSFSFLLACPLPFLVVYPSPFLWFTPLLSCGLPLSFLVVYPFPLLWLDPSPFLWFTSPPSCGLPLLYGRLHSSMLIKSPANTTISCIATCVTLLSTYCSPPLASCLARNLAGACLFSGPGLGNPTWPAAPISRARPGKCDLTLLHYDMLKHIKLTCLLNCLNTANRRFPCTGYAS
jgi:hypothetical protein